VATAIRLSGTGKKLTFNRTKYPDLSFLVEATNYSTTTWYDQGYLEAMQEVGTTKICDNAISFNDKYGPTSTASIERKEQCIYGFEANWHPTIEDDGSFKHFEVVLAYGIFNHTTLKDVFLTRCESIEAEDERSVLLMKEALENSIFKNDMQLRVSAMAIDAYLTSARFRSVTSYNSFQNSHDNMISTFKLVLTTHLDSSVARVASVWRDVGSVEPLETYASDLILDSSTEWYDELTEGIMFTDLASDEEGCIELCNHFEPVDCSYYSEPTPLQVFFYALTIMGAFGWVYGFWAVALPHKIISQLYKINTIFKTTDGRLHGGKKIF